LPPHFCLFHSHYAGISHIMSNMKIQSWKSGKTTINQWEGRAILRHTTKKRCGPVSALSRLFWPFFLGTYCLLGSLQANCWIMEMKNKMAQTWWLWTCHCGYTVNQW
jgi:hypothetical protein